MADKTNWPLLRTYAEAVRRGLMKIEDVKEAYRADVQAILNGELTEKK